MGLAVRKTKDAVLLDGCAQQTALAVGASAESVRVEFQRITVPKPANTRPVSTSGTEPVVQTEPPSQQERWLLRLAFYDQAFSDWAADCLDLRWVKHSQVRAILERAAQTGASVEILVNDLDADSSRLLTGVLAEASEIPDPSRQLKDLVTRMRDQYLDLKLAALTRLMAQPNLPEEELMRALEEQRELQGQKHELLPLVPARESS
jgi:hypothetical protein